jgi:hypothetical protein
MDEQPKCDVCGSTGWVCEDHRDRPWDGTDHDCGCGGAGAPCPACNQHSRPNEDTP